MHFHTLVLDGVFSEAGPGGLTFHPAPPPTDADVTEVLAAVRRRVRRLLIRRHLEPGGDAESGPPDPVAEASPALAGLVGASVQGRVALGPRAGTRVRRVGVGLGGSEAPRAARGPRQAQLDGFDLHANVWVPATDRARLEQLARYLLRPPLAQARVRRRADGRVVVELKRPWHDGTTHLLFEPIEFLEKLAALTPRPGVNLLLYHGVLAPHARWRRQVTGYGRTGAADSCGGPADVVALPGPEARGPLRYRPWAELMRRAFAIDVLACPQCGGRLRLIATIVDPAVIAAILAAVGLPRAGPAPAAPPAIAGGGRRAGPTP